LRGNLTEFLGGFEDQEFEFSKILGLFALGFKGFEKRRCLRFEIGHEGSLIPTQSADAPWLTGASHYVWKNFRMCFQRGQRRAGTRLLDFKPAPVGLWSPAPTKKQCLVGAIPCGRPVFDQKSTPGEMHPWLTGSKLCLFTRNLSVGFYTEIMLRRLLPLGILLGLPIVIVGAAYLTLIVLAPVDVPFKPDEALLPKLERVPEDQNAVAMISRLGAQIKGDEDVRGTRTIGLNNMIQANHPVDAKTRAVLKQNTAVLEGLERAVNLPRAVSQARNPQWQSFEQFSKNGIANLIELQKPIQLMLLRAKIRSHDGDARAAWQDGLKAVRAASRIRNAGPTLIEHLVASSLQTRSLQFLRTVIPRLPQGEYRTALQSLEPTTDSYRAVASSEYRMYVLAMTDVKTNHDAVLEIVSGSSGEASETAIFAQFARGLPQRWRSQPGRTLERLTQNVRAIKDTMGRCPPQGNAAPAQTVSGFGVLEPNAIGRTLESVLVPDMRNANKNFCDLRLEHAVTQTALALRLKQLETSGLPDTLSDTLAGLEKLPLDPYSSKLLLWNANSKTLKSASGQSFKLEL
jgi:hypothetical protein